MDLVKRTNRISTWKLALIFVTPLALQLGYRQLAKRYLIEKQKKEEEEEKERYCVIIETKEKKEGEFDIDCLIVEEGEKLSLIEVAKIYKAEGNKCFHEKDYKNAISFYDKAIYVCPTQERYHLAIFYHNRATAYERVGDWDKVKKDCTRALQHHPRYAKAYYRRARAQEATNNLQASLADAMATCILRMFKNKSMIMYADRVLQNLSLREASKHMKHLKPLLPSPFVFNNYMSSFVNDPLQLLTIPFNGWSGGGYLRARRALDAEKYEDVIPACTEEMELADSKYKSETLLLRGTMHYLCGSYSLSKLDLDAVINDLSAGEALRANAFIRRSNLFMQLGDSSRSDDDSQAAEQLMPHNPDIFYHRGQIAMQFNRISQAFDYFEKAEALAPDHALATVHKCYCKYRLALESENVELINQCVQQMVNILQKFPKNSDCFSVFAQVLTEQQCFPQADTFYSKALALSPTNAVVLVQYATMMLQWQGGTSTARTMLRRAIEVDSKCAIAYVTLGTVELQEGNLHESIDLFNRGIYFARNKAVVEHLYLLHNAALGQINAISMLGINTTALKSIVQHGLVYHDVV